MRKFIDIILENQNVWPPRIEGWDLAERAQDLHHTSEDFYEGDIAQNISAFGWYDLKRIPVSAIERDLFTIHDELVDDYATRSGEEAPPVIFDSEQGYCIDGNHRVEAAVQRGDQYILAYVADQSSYAPFNDGEGEYDDDDDDDDE